MASPLRSRPAVAGMRVVLVGVGAVGSRVARQVAATADLEALALVDTDRERAVAVAEALGPPAVVTSWSPSLLEGAHVVILCLSGQQLPLAEEALRYDVDLVAISDREDDVRGLLALDQEARARGCHVVVGAGFSPGLSCLLARHAANLVDEVDEVRVARTGSGAASSPADQRRMLSGEGSDWRAGSWTVGRAGTGRELCWFPEPVGARDCYRAPLADPLLLAPAFPSASRVSARLAVTRLDRLTWWLPLPRRVHQNGTVEAIRVEVRGRRGRAREAVVLGAIDHPDVAAGTVAAVAADWARSGRLSRTGSAGLAELVPNPVPFLHELAARGVRAATFDPGSERWLSGAQAGLVS